MTREEVGNLIDSGKCLGALGTPYDAAKLSLLNLQQIVLSFVDRAGLTDETQIEAVNALTLAAILHGWWGKCDLIYPFVGGTDTAHAQNLKSSSFTITWNGTVTHDANGITGDGATGYGDTGYNPSSSGKVALNSAHLGIYRRTTGSTVNRNYCGIQLGADAFFLGVGSPLTNVNYRVNDGSFNAVTLTSLGWLAGARFDAANKHLYQGGIDTSNANASTNVVSGSCLVLARNSPAASFSDSNLAVMTVGSGITFSEYQLMASDWQTFQTALGRQV